jgi:hypothetical protein
MEPEKQSRAQASRINGLLGGRPRKWHSDAERQLAYRQRHGMHGNEGSLRPRGWPSNAEYFRLRNILP